MSLASPKLNAVKRAFRIKAGLALLTCSGSGAPIIGNLAFPVAWFKYGTVYQKTYCDRPVTVYLPSLTQDSLFHLSLLLLTLFSLSYSGPYCRPSFNYFIFLGMTLNWIHIFIVTGSFLYWCVMRPASQHFFIHSNIFLRILIISYLATFLGTNSLSVLMCRKAVNQSINYFSHCKEIKQFGLLFNFRPIVIKWIDSKPQVCQVLCTWRLYRCRQLFVAWNASFYWRTSKRSVHQRASGMFYWLCHVTIARSCSTRSPSAWLSVRPCSPSGVLATAADRYTQLMTGSRQYQVSAIGWRYSSLAIGRTVCRDVRL